MIVLDTHIWIWWVQGDARLSASQNLAIQENETDRLGISAISCWEVAKLVEKGQLQLPVDLDKWFELALGYPGIELLPISPAIAIASTSFPANFSHDPADQLIAATAQSYSCPLVTSDAKLSGYSNLQTIA